MRRTILVSSASGLIQIVTNALLIAFTVPIFIGKMGLGMYGVFALISVVSYYNILGNFGFNTSLIKYLAEQGKVVESNYDIVSITIFLLVTLVPMASIAVVKADVVMHYVLQIPVPYVNNVTRACFVFMVFSNVFLLLGQVPSAILDSLQKVYLTNTIQVLYNVLSRGLVLVVLLVEPRLDSIGLAILASTVLWWIVLSLSAVRSWRFYEMEGFWKNVVRVSRKHLVYGSKVYASGILGFLFEPANKLLVGRFVGLKEVVFFDIALRVKGVLWSVFERILYPLVPHIASLRDESKIKQLIGQLERKLILALIPVGVTVVYVAHPFIQLWIGNDVDITANATRFLVVVNLFALVFLPFYQFLLVKDLPGKTVLLQGSNVVVDLFFFAVLVPWFGFYGVIAAFVMGMLSSILVCVFLQRRYLQGVHILSRSYFSALLILIAVLVVLDTGLSIVFKDPRVQLLLVPLFNFGASFIVWRETRMITFDDVNQIFGSSPSAALLISKLLVRND